LEEREKKKGKGKGKGKGKKSHMQNRGPNPQNLILVLQLGILLYGCEEIKERGKEIHYRVGSVAQTLWWRRLEKKVRTELLCLSRSKN
jgi:hypothetical protein